MFDNLVESGSHKDDISRKGSFLLGTFVIYSIVLVALGILSIYLVNANLPDPSLELLSFVSQVKEPPAPQQPEQQQQKKPAASEEKQEFTERQEISEFVPPDFAKTKEEAKYETPSAPKIPFKITERNYNPENAYTGPSGPISMGTGEGTGGPPAPTVVDSGDDAPPPPPPPPPKKSVTISGGVLNGKAISKPPPGYPPIAKAARASGAVTVQITVDESGRVVSAQAVSGHPLLQQAAANAVRNWRFSPTLLSGQPVKVTGQVIVNFNLQ